MTPTIYELDAYGEATRARHFCTVTCRAVAIDGHAGPIAVIDEVAADIMPGETCETCGAVLDGGGVQS